MLNINLPHIVFAPYIDLSKHSFLDSNGENFKNINKIDNYKYLVFADEQDVTSLIICPNYCEQRALIFGYIAKLNAVVREYIDPTSSKYVIEVLILTSDVFNLQYSLGEEHIQTFTS